MKFAECSCKECGQEFKITFLKTHPEIIHCPKCTSVLVKYNWINGDVD